jgi:thiosulfate/3-mercaptopyruvate sulfurtransferase
MSFGPLVQPGWLRDRLGEPGLLVVDCRFVLGQPGAGATAWLEGRTSGRRSARGRPRSLRGARPRR